MDAQSSSDYAESLSSSNMWGVPVNAAAPDGAPVQALVNDAIQPRGKHAKAASEEGGRESMRGGQPAQDPMTGAFNMPGFVMNFALALQNEDFEQIALCYLDIRNFRSINPNHGYIVGNSVLKTLVSDVRLFLSGDLPVCRLGADRFIFLTEGMDYERANERFVELERKFNAQTREMGIVQPLELTAGIYFLRPEDRESRNFNRCMDFTSIAHKNAKGLSSSNLVLFTDEDLERDRRRVIIEQSIDAALEEGQIEVWYQPQVDYAYGSIVGAEALARWNHPELGWVSPAEFVPILELGGKVHDLDLYVWEEACRCASRWRDAADGNPVPISVNISGSEMLDEDITGHFIALREKYNLPPGSLRLEVTESAFVEEAARLYRAIDNMRANDVLVEMDDFGNGLSSLHMLKDVPVDVVKLDMGFLKGAISEKRGGVVLGSVIRMLQGLDTPIIAEGVETLEQAEMLKNMGCHLMQGFHFSAPMPKKDFENFLSTNSTLETANRRQRRESNLKDIMSFDPTSSFIFNNAVGGMILFYIDSGTSECIMVNDEFYEECGLDRNSFADRRIDPVLQVEESSRETLWRAAAEARERGTAICTAKVTLSGRWIDCFLKYIGESASRSVFSMVVIRSSTVNERVKAVQQIAQDTEWNLNLLSAIVPNAFVKCALDDMLTIDYISPNIIEAASLTHEEFMRAFHNSFANMLAPDQRSSIIDAAYDSALTGDLIDREVLIYQTFESMALVKLIARAKVDDEGKKWLYCMLLNKGTADKQDSENSVIARDRVIPFDYNVAEDRLTVMVPLADGSFEEAVMEKWVATFDSLSDYVSEASFAKISATIRDLRNHPLSGFTDVKCRIFEGESQRWYHVNYACDADENGITTEIHGFAQDANDKMGSAKWWRRQAEIDYLTGLLNRNAVEQNINTSMRSEGSGMMFMIDLDSFKRVNDEFGHLSGDALLREVAARLESAFRDNDVIGRYGGDEFIAFVPISSDKARAIAEVRAKEIVDTISKIEIPDGTYAGCSVGVAISKDREATFYDLLEVADQAMYESKFKGKGIYTIKEM